MLIGSFEAILDALSDGVMVVDSAGEVLYANAMAESLFACPQGLLRGRYVDMLVPAALASRHAEHRRAYSHSPTVWNMESRGCVTPGYRLDGTVVALYIKLAPVSVGDVSIIVVSLREGAADQSVRANPSAP